MKEVIDPPSPQTNSAEKHFPHSNSSDWWSEALRQVLEQKNFLPLLEAAHDLFRRKRVLDVIVSPGQASARIQGEQTTSPGRSSIKNQLEQPKYFQAQYTFTQLSDSEWEHIFQRLAQKAFYLAKLLASELPPEIQEVFQTSGGLIPSHASELKIACTCQRNVTSRAQNPGETKPPRACVHAAALYYKLCDQIATDPFLFFLLRGRGREETLAQIRRCRKQETHFEQTSLRQWDENQKRHDISPEIKEETFWKAGDKLWALLYTMKADELPAAVLRRLDPLIHGGQMHTRLEFEIDHILEEAYAQIARRAQAFGLGLSRGGNYRA